jgi:exonuclease SbcC
MTINRVYLENYRVHEKFECEFVKGINLLLGLNGKGKSSVLEAIGYALFSSDLRKRNQMDAVRHGARKAKIHIEFTGIDGTDYIVEKDIPGGSRFYKKGDEPNPNISSENKIEEIKKLCGIKGDIKGIYDNIIIAKQNEFINVFKLADAERESVFNKVFNTEIYRKIYEGYGKAVIDNYGKLLNEENVKLSTHSNMTGDPKLKREELTEEIKNEIVIIKQLKEEKALLDNISKNIREYENIEKDLKNKENNIKIFNENIEKEKINKKNWEDKISQSNKAKEILNRTKKDYDEYETLKTVLEDLKEKRKEIESKKNIYLEKEKLQKNIDLKIKELEGNKKEISKELENQKVQKIEFEKEISEKKEESERNTKLSVEYREKLISIENLKTEVDKYDSTLKDWNDKASKKKSELDTLKESIDKLSKEIENVAKEAYDKKLGEFEKIEIKKNNLSNQRVQEESLLRANNEAFEQLKGLTCPYLNENCKNLEGKNIEKIFDEKSEIYGDNIKDLTGKIEELEFILKEKDSVNKKLILQNNNISQKEKNKIELDKQEILLNSAFEKIVLKEKEYLLYREKNNIKDRDQLIGESGKLNESIRNLNLNKINDEIVIISNKIKDITKKLFDNNDKLSKTNIEIENKNNAFKEIGKYLDENKKILDEYDTQKKILEAKEIEQKSKENGHSLYVSNKREAEELDNYKKNFDNAEASINETVDKTKNENIKKEQLSEKLKEIDIDKYNIEKKQKDLFISELEQKFGQIQNRQNTLKEEIEKIEKDLKIIEEIKKRIKKLESKYELATIFRDNIKSMGKEMTKNILSEIALEGTENFRKITGRSEYINWSSDEKNKYLVSLNNEEKSISFENLSGGEQVAVAISMRGAMSTIFTKSKFSIFDEPTNNLDIEKRKSLAESIGEILKNLDQSIIVTHDDTFREMAQKVIEL